MSSSAQAPFESSHKIRGMTEEDLEEALKLIQTEDWFLTKPKMEITFREGIVSYFILEDIKNSRMMGVMNVTPTRPNEASLGNVIIQPGFRGQGLGSYFLAQVFKQYPSTILSWFSEADPFYERLGSQAGGECGFYYELLINRNSVDSFCESNRPEGIVTIPYSDKRFEDLHQYDIEARGYDNRPYLTVVTRTCDHLLLAVRETDQSIVGYAGTWNDNGVLRPNGMYADDDKIAGLLFKETIKRYPSLNAMKYFTMTSKFLHQFGKINMEVPHNRLSFGGIPVRIPEKKLYCTTEPDMSY